MNSSDKLFAVLLGSLIAGAGYPQMARAEDPSAASTSTPTVDSLNQRLTALEQQVQTNQTNTTTASSQQSQASAAGVTAEGRQGFTIKSPDGNFKLQFSGLLQTDARFYTSGGASTASDTFLVRRARPILAGTLDGFYGFFIQPDFGQGTTVLYDAYLEIKPWDYLNFRAGKFKNPLGLERLQTDSYLLFAERSLASDLIPQRDTGVEFYGGFLNNALTYQTSLTNGAADGGLDDLETSNHPEGDLRIFAQPFKNTSVRVLQKLGLGVAGSYSGLNTQLPTFKTESGQTTFFSYNSNVNANGEHARINPEANYYNGAFGFQSEYVKSSEVLQLTPAKGAIAKDRLANEAWDVATSWVLTGENASYTGVMPKHNFDPHAGTWGAWEIAARYSELRVDPDTFTLGFSPATSAQKAQAVTLGINWYLNGNVRITTDYTDTNYTGGNLSANGKNTIDRPDEQVFLTRWQLAF